MKRILTVLFITLLVLAAFAIPRSDNSSRKSYDDIKSTIFSYKRENVSESRLELLGIVYKIDLEKATVLSGKIEQLLSYNIGCLPEGTYTAAKSFAQAITDITDRLIAHKWPALLHNTAAFL